MMLETGLAIFHWLAILTLVVFISSEAALCRAEWLNAAVVKRLQRVDLIYGIAAVALLASGLLRAFLGMKGADWYWSQPLLHAKLTLFVIVGLMSIKPTLTFRRWGRELDATGRLPEAAEIAATRRLVMIQAHLILVFPILGAMLARGVLTR
jgi:putative membrane protein